MPAASCGRHDSQILKIVFWAVRGSIGENCKVIVRLCFLVSIRKYSLVLFGSVFELVSSDEVHLTPDSSPELTKRSWFGNLMTTEKDETFTVLVKGKPLATIKAHLIHAFLSVMICSLATYREIFISRVHTFVYRLNPDG